MSVAKVAVAGVGMHPWGKWGENFVTYGVAAARAALADAGVDWSDVGFVAGADTMRNGYPGYVAGATFAQALGWTGIPVTSAYGACASGAMALEAARQRILAGLCDVALVVGADTTPKGFLKPNAGERTDDPDWLRFNLLGATNPTYFALYARRRMELFGATQDDFTAVKVKNAAHGLSNPFARYRKEVSAADVDASPLVASPLRLLDICATSDGGAAVVLTSQDYAEAHLADRPRVDVAAISTVTPTFPNTVIEMPEFATDSAAGIPAPQRTFKQAIGHAAYEQAGVSPGDVEVAEVYDLSTALELDWYEDLQFCAPGEAEQLLRDGVTTLGGRLPVNPSGGLACFGEAVPAQALAQVCEITWQLRGQAGDRQAISPDSGEAPKVGITANQGLFGHGSSVILTR
ncbi:MAG: lipid-transfer protein [Microthrixaceae bacterium]|nr:lipid-transfer protein [Microthrixaceae bacterium]MCO5316879.1 lipid-transfer protein [Microthrixaceae bacterium]